MIPEKLEKPHMHMLSGKTDDYNKSCKVSHGEANDT